MDINRAARQRGKYPPLSQLLRWIVLLIHLGTSLSARQSGSAKCITWFNWKVNINHHSTYIQLLLEIYLTTYKMRGTANIVLLSLKPVKYLPDFKLIIKAEAKMSIIYSVKEIMSCLVLSRGRREEKHRFLDHTIIVFTSSCNCEI